MKCYSTRQSRGSLVRHKKALNYVCLLRISIFDQLGLTLAAHLPEISPNHQYSKPIHRPRTRHWAPIISVCAYERRKNFLSTISSLPLCEILTPPRPPWVWSRFIGDGRWKKEWLRNRSQPFVTLDTSIVCTQALFYQISAYLPYKLFPKVSPPSIVLVTFTTYIYVHYKDSFHTLLPPNPCFLLLSPTNSVSKSYHWTHFIIPLDHF